MKKIIPEGSMLVPDAAKLVFQGDIFDVYQWPQELFDGSTETFEMLKRPDTVNAICIVDDKIILLEEEQPYTGARQSFPGGRVDPEDASLEAAIQREVAEETGYSFHNWRLIRAWQPYHKIEWFGYAWLAWDVAGQQPPHTDPGEKIIARQLDFQALKRKVLRREGYLGDAITIFEKLESIEQLLSLPEFTGQTVDR